jgi:uncharacterized membrane protein
LSLIGSTAAVVALTVLAAVELVADKLPRTPNRTSPPGLIARILGGGATGACVAVAGSQWIIAGAILGALGGVVGCFAGFQARTRFAKAIGGRDFYVAVIEDIVAIAGCLFAVSQV